MLRSRWRLLLRIAVLAALGLVCSEGHAGAIRRVSAFDGHDPRETVQDYAASHDSAAVLRASGAVGRLSCKSRVATANVTLRANIITSVGHILCDSHSQPADCAFTYVSGEQSKTVEVADGVTKLNCAHFAGADDWAVLTLRQPVEGPTPLDIDPHRVEAAESPIDVVLIANYAIDFCAKSADRRCLRDKASGDPIKPKFIEDCEVRYIGDTEGVPSQLVNDCASSFGASGAAVLARDLRHPVLLGVQVNVPESKAEQAVERRTGMPIIKPFSLANRWSAIANPVDGAFAQALLKAAGAPASAKR